MNIKNGMVYGTPESQGLSSRALAKMLQELRTKVEDFHSIAVVKNDVIVMESHAEPFGPANRKMLHSLAKSINSIAVGIAIDEGKLGLDDYLLDYVSDKLPDSYDRRLKRMTIRHMLMMAASSCPGSIGFLGAEHPWMTHYLGLELPAEPGTVFNYDTGASYMLSCLVSRVMGKTSFALVKERVFEPMGITDAKWLTSPEGHTVGGWGLYLTTEDLIKVGKLLMHKGEWDGQQLVPAWWVEEATKSQIAVKDGSGRTYGYQFWVREHAFSLLGAFGQTVMCSKDENLFVVLTAGTGDDRKQNDIVYRVLMETDEACHVGPEDPEGQRRLQMLETDLLIDPPYGRRSAVAEEEMFHRVIELEDNRRNLHKLKLSRMNKQLIRLEMTIDGVEYSFDAGYQDWTMNELPEDDCQRVPADDYGFYHCFRPDRFVHNQHALAYAWIGDSLTVKHYWLNTTYIDTFSLHLEGERLKGTLIRNVAMGENAPVDLLELPRTI